MTFNSGWGKKGLIDVYIDNSAICDQILEGRRKLPNFVFVSISRSDFFTQGPESDNIYLIPENNGIIPSLYYFVQ